MTKYNLMRSSHAIFIFDKIIASVLMRDECAFEKLIQNCSLNCLVIITKFLIDFSGLSLFLSFSISAGSDTTKRSRGC